MDKKDNLDLIVEQELLIKDLTEQLNKALDIIDDLQEEVSIGAKLLLKYQSVIDVTKGLHLLSGKKEKLIN